MLLQLKHAMPDKTMSQQNHVVAVFETDQHWVASTSLSHVCTGHIHYICTENVKSMDTSNSVQCANDGALSGCLAPNFSNLALHNPTLHIEVKQVAVNAVI